MDNFDRTFNWAFAVTLMLVVAFWVTVGVVGFHFLAKVW